MGAVGNWGGGVHVKHNYSAIPHAGLQTDSVMFQRTASGNFETISQDELCSATHTHNYIYYSSARPA